MKFSIKLLNTPLHTRPVPLLVISKTPATTKMRTIITKFLNYRYWDIVLRISCHYLFLLPLFFNFVNFIQNKTLHKSWLPIGNITVKDWKRNMNAIPYFHSKHFKILNVTSERFLGFGFFSFWLQYIATVSLFQH